MSDKPLQFPPRLIIEANNYCNLACPSCLTGTRQREHYGQMPLSTLQKIAHEVAGHQECTFISLQGGGEPLMHPQIGEFIEEIHNIAAPNVLTHISTNATLLSEEKSSMLLEGPLDQIYFSVDGTTAEVYEKLRPGAHFPQVIDNILRFLEIKKIKNRIIRTGVTFVRQQDNEHQVEDFRAFWEGKVDLVNIITYQTYTGTITDRRTTADKDRVPETRYPCKQLMRGDFIIHWDGHVFGCCRNIREDLLLGNVNIESIEDLFNGDKRQKLVRRHRELRWDDIESCRNCLQEWSF